MSPQLKFIANNGHSLKITLEVIGLVSYFQGNCIKKGEKEETRGLGRRGCALIPGTAQGHTVAAQVPALTRIPVNPKGDRRKIM